MGNVGQPLCKTCVNHRSPVNGGLDCSVAEDCMEDECNPYRRHVERTKGRVFTPPLELLVLYYVPRSKVLADIELRVQKVCTFDELREVEKQVARAQDPRDDEEWGELQKTEHPVRFALPVERQMLLHIMKNTGLMCEGIWAG